MWLHSSVGRASHWYRRGHGFESHWSPDIFQASSFQLLKLENLMQWSLFSFIYNRSTIWIPYIFHIISLHGKTWTQQSDLNPNVWLHSSVGQASHWYHRGHGFESHWNPDIFQASSFQLLKLENLLWQSLFIFNIHILDLYIWTHSLKILIISVLIYCFLGFVLFFVSSWMCSRPDQFRCALT